MALLLAAPTGPAGAQAALLVHVRRADAESPIEGAVVRAVRSGAAGVTDRRGTARLSGFRAPDTLLVVSIGFEPLRLPVAPGVERVEVLLAAAPVRVADLSVSGEPTLLRAPSRTGGWVLTREALDAFPDALEPDPLRALALVPSVSFSSPLSARPNIRGYDAAESAIRLDGFELHSPFHLGRIFSGIPAQALASAAVRPLPLGGDAGTLVGVIDLEGRAGGGAAPLAGGAQASLVSLSGWAATRSPALFVAPRVTFLEVATELVTQEGLPYGFQDVYAGGRLGRAGGPRGSWTLLASHDDFGDVGRDTGMDWHNVLAGTRWRLLDGPRGGTEVALSANRFDLQGTRVVLGSDLVDLENRLERLRIAVDGDVVRRNVSLRAGVELGHRSSLARLVSVASSVADTLTDEAGGVTEFRARADAGVASGPLRVEAGLLLDATSSATSWQPRARLVADVGARGTVSLAAARASRPFQVLTDPQSEPTLGFFEVWLDAGVNGVPVPAVNHVALSADLALGPWSLHGAAFGSQGAGLGEPRPDSDPEAGETPYRFGRSRTRGLELRAARGGATPGSASWAATYVVSWSERDWGDGWVPWRLDRRHQLRLQADVPLGGWRLFWTGEVASGQPVTPVEEVIWRFLPAAADPTQAAPRSPAYRYGREGGLRGRATFHLSLGARRQFKGLFGLRTTLAASITNLVFGPVAPDRAADFAELFSEGQASSTGSLYRRKFTLPAVPSVLLGVEF